jgi:hypothetical protein
MKKQHYLKNWSQKHFRHGQLRIPALFPCAAARGYQSLQGQVWPTSSEYKNGVWDLNIQPRGVKVMRKTKRTWRLRRTRQVPACSIPVSLA